MSKLVVERQVAVVPESDNGSATGSNAIWAIAFVLIVAMIAGVLYYSGVLRTRPAGPAAEKINVDVKTN